jgi:tetratricopeptide (TPR) repeat protein
MKSAKHLKQDLEAAAQALDALDADLAAGRVSADEHGRRRAEREREAGRLYVDLRRAQRAARARRAEPAGMPAPSSTGWWRNPVALVALAGVLVAGGIGAGMAASRWLQKPPGGGAETVAAAGAARPPGMSPIELEALRQVAARDDAPVPSLLQLAHVALDEGRLDEARRLYARVLAREPRNAEAITHVGSVLYQEGRVDEALAKVEEALRIDPRYVHAHWDRTQYLFHAKRDFPAAIKAAEAFLAVVPQGPDADSVRRLLAEARREQAPKPGTAPPPR